MIFSDMNEEIELMQESVFHNKCCISDKRDRSCFLSFFNCPFFLTY